MTRWVEIRRHSFTKKGEARGRGSHLSQTGVRLARELGATIGPFATVVSSDIPRTLETALAMGYAVDDALPFPGETEWDAVIGEMGWHVLWELDRPFTFLREVLPDRSATRQMAEYYAEAWRSIGLSLTDDQAALVLTHGLIIEAGLVAAFPSARHDEWGAPFSHCEGARLEMRGDDFVSVELLRLETAGEG